jgi:tetratricopeptide (TPR) repeat protein
MQIIHILDSFFYTIFPELAGKIKDDLVHALQVYSHNGWALLMMGNIFAKYKKDIDTAIKYCDQAMASNTADHISLTNAAYLAYSQKRLFKASDYIEKALSIKKDYPNALSVKAMICDARGEDEDAFEYYIKAIKSSHKKDQVWKNAFDQAVDIAKRIVATNTGDKLIELYSKKLEYLGGKEIHVEIALDIAIPAKMEFGENHNRPCHLIRYKDTYPGRYGQKNKKI